MYKFDHFMLGPYQLPEIYWSQTDASTLSHIWITTCKKKGVDTNDTETEIQEMIVCEYRKEQ